ncbi:PREDICTED: uncharacterized protein LOC107072080 [Polistes dominula]|uniref:Uncharacterized protein LOC107072080 n=1 Tax=Polistes dominula TaxID=743375 RepID=A0ABM1J3Z0_POLDO|nr:PREDICTED: uncharacterized protein LOC107072080 [Polistes dominula]XP_015187178.1 PREDICTED: uncharacterized protein LOC107072080 [Polistes dominula]
MVEMFDWENEDPLTTLNTQLNKSMALFESVGNDDQLQLNKNNKSIKINTKSNSTRKRTSVNGTQRRSILKKSEVTNGEEKKLEEQSEETPNRNVDINEAIPEASSNALTVTSSSSSSSSSSRPQNLEDLIKAENLTMETNSSFNIDDISDSEDIWILNIPKTVNTEELIGQTLTLGDKSKLKVGEKKYCAVKQNMQHGVTCVFSTSKTNSLYKAVNIKPAGSITIRRKLSSIPKGKPILLDKVGVPFPENLRTRHPLLGVTTENKFKRESKMVGSRKRKRKQ